MIVSIIKTAIISENLFFSCSHRSNVFFPLLESFLKKYLLFSSKTLIVNRWEVKNSLVFKTTHSSKIGFWNREKYGVEHVGF